MPSTTTRRTRSKSRTPATTAKKEKKKMRGTTKLRTPAPPPPRRPLKLAADRTNHHDIFSQIMSGRHYLSDAELMRDFVFIIIAGLFLTIMYQVETSSPRDKDDREILDLGFTYTETIHDYLQRNSSANDLFAALNSLFLGVMMMYPLWRTFVRDDFSLAFQMGATLFFRAFCGWLTYLPSPSDFLPSIYDMPELFHCILGPYVGFDFGSECKETLENPLPFVTFFSGHTAITVIVANDMWRKKWSRTSLALHFFNLLQMIRLLATRGHYSIDIVIGWVVAIYVSSPAARVGRKFSKIKNVSEFVAYINRKVHERPVDLFLPPDTGAMSPKTTHS